MGKTTYGMQVAKASADDISAAMDLAVVIDGVMRGYYPTINNEETETTPAFFDEDNFAHLQQLHRVVKSIADRGGLMRVVLGMDTILRNDILDPDLDHIEIHPRFAAEKQRLRDALAGLIGASDVNEIRGMELAVRQLHACGDDTAVILNAIHALIETAPDSETAPEVAHG